MTIEKNNDEQDMLFYKSNDLEAFNRLYQKYSPIIYGYLRKKLPSHEVEDLFQIVWIHLHQKKHLYDNQPFAPWFFFIIKNLITDHYRAQGSRSKTIERFHEEVLSTKENDQDLSLLDSLTPENRELIEKYYVEGQSYTDLEKEYQVSQTALRKRLSRVMGFLKQKAKDSHES